MEHKELKDWYLSTCFTHGHVEPHSLLDAPEYQELRERFRKEAQTGGTWVWELTVAPDFWEFAPGDAAVLTDGIFWGDYERIAEKSTYDIYFLVNPCEGYDFFVENGWAPKYPIFETTRSADIYLIVVFGCLYLDITLKDFNAPKGCETFNDYYAYLKLMENLDEEVEI